jgi:DNA polymerase III subunit delta
MPINPQQLERQLAGGTLAPVYLVAGSEDLLRLEAADAVRAAARAQGFAEREVFEAGSGFDWNSLHASFSAMSLFASRRLLDVRLPTGKPGKEGAALIEGFCKDPPPDLCLLIVAADWSRAHEANWSRAVEKAGRFVQVWPLKANELPGWIKARLHSRGVRADADAVALLAERVEGNLLAAAQEVDKLALLAPGETIDAARMQQLVADSARFDVFGLTEAALGGDVPRALRMLHGLRAEGGQVPQLISWVATQVQVLAALSATQEAGGNLPQAMRDLRVFESRQPLFRRALARGNCAHFERLVAACALIERSGKGRAGGDPWLQFERMLVALGSPAAAPAMLAGRLE